MFLSCLVVEDEVCLLWFWWGLVFLVLAGCRADMHYAVEMRGRVGMLMSGSGREGRVSCNS